MVGISGGVTSAAVAPRANVPLAVAVRLGVLAVVDVRLGNTGPTRSRGVTHDGAPSAFPSPDADVKGAAARRAVSRTTDV
jgi:hypothetical protein